VTDEFILGGVRRAFGRYGGSLSHLRTDDLLGTTMMAACKHLGVPLVGSGERAALEIQNGEVS
jgi:acetyl-CoA acetyltransferase